MSDEHENDESENDQDVPDVGVVNRADPDAALHRKHPTSVDPVPQCAAVIGPIDELNAEWVVVNFDKSNRKRDRCGNCFDV